MQLKRVLVDGKRYPILYDMYALSLLMDEAKTDFGGILEMAGRFGDFAKMQGGDLRFVFDVIYIGFKNGSEEEGIEFPYTKRQLSRLIPLTGETIEEIMLEFQNGMTSSIAPEEQKKTSPKKVAKTKKLQSTG